MESLIFILYLLIFCSFFYYYQAQKGSGLTIWTVLFLFAIKVMAGCINLYVHQHEYINNDIHFYQQQSLLDLKEFQHHPLLFMKEWLFNWGDISNHFNLLKKENIPFWSNLGALIHAKYLNLANLFTLGSLYTNVIFFNVIYFLGALQLYKVFYALQPSKKWLFISAIFFIPSVLFWCSGIHKDGWVFASIGFTCYYSFKYLQHKKVSDLLGILLSLSLLFVSRYFVFLCFIIPYLLWVSFSSHPKRLFLFTGLMIASIILLFTIGQFSSIEPLEIIVEKQKNFFALIGYSDMKTPILESSFSSFATNFSSACNHIFLQPYFVFNTSAKYQIAALDTWLVTLSIVVMCFYIKKENLHSTFYLMLVLFSFFMYLFIGYTIPNCGALVRYKSEFTGLLIPALMALSEVPFLKRFYAAS